MTRLHVCNLRSESDGDQRIVAADFVVGRRERSVWFRTDNGPLTDLADPFLPVALTPAMRRKWSVEIDGPVSPILMRGAREIQGIMHGWFPELHEIDVTAETPVSEPAAKPDGVASFFSGGVDSFHTLLKHRADITHLIFVHGFDLPLSFQRERERAAASVREAAASLGLQVVEVETNLRQFGQPHVGWVKAYFGPALAAVALLLSARFHRIYLPASVSTDQLIPMASHPAIDPKWSNGVMQLIHDGLEATRFEKIRDIGSWQPVREHLRVCFQRNSAHVNCGRCRKCVWTMMMLKATGDLDHVKTFGEPLDVDELQLYPPVPKYERDRFEEAIALLERRNADPEFRAILQKMLDANGKLPLAGRLKRLMARSRNYLVHRL